MTLGANAEVATEFFGGRLGALAPGYGADLIIVDYDPYTAMNEGSFWGHMLFGMRGGQVRGTTGVAFASDRLHLRLSPLPRENANHALSVATQCRLTLRGEFVEC